MHFHKWTFYSDYKELELTYGWGKSRALIQERNCEVCGKKQFKKVNII